MVTRNIKANEPTQVNAELIGVQVSPIVSGISADITTYTATATLRYVVNGEGVGRIFVDAIGDIYYNTLITESISDITYYIHRRPGSDVDYYCQMTASMLNPGDPVYVKEDDSLVQYSTVDHLLNIEGTGTQINSSTVVISNTEYSIFNYPEDGSDIFIKDDQNVIVGYIRSITTSSASESFELAESSSVADKTQWNNEGSSVWTDSRKPVIGDVVYTTADELDWNQSSVSGVEDGSESYPCTVSYSVTGDVWTAVGSEMTDRNNVICHIPRYVYLKFSEDVTITEE